jgi:tetratricopeptide (TPR) repeat protein
MMNININRTLVFSITVLMVSVNFSCKKFLDARPSSSLSRIKVDNLQSILDDYGVMNSGYPNYGEVSSDDYFLLDASYNLPNLQPERDLYTWRPRPQLYPTAHDLWATHYKVIYNTNLVLETLNEPEGKATDAAITDPLRGSARFFSAYAYFQLAQLYAKPYDATTAAQDLGIPIRKSALLDDKPKRGTVEETYTRIVDDLKEAINLLPISSTVKSRPNKKAAYAALARTYLAMGDYVNAGKMADECLKLYNTLINFNTLSKTSLTPFSRFNDEVLFHATAGASTALNPATAKVNRNLYDMFAANDLRKQIYFKAVGSNYKFSGNYEPVTTGTMFTGLAVDEVYLIRAECYARGGHADLAMTDLNTLLRSRWSGAYTDMTAIDGDDALVKVLNERRKELIFRGLRWSDLRRLNKETRFQITLSRTALGETYTLPPNDLRYTLIIPQMVLDQIGGEQNPR